MNILVKPSCILAVYFSQKKPQTLDWLIIGLTLSQQLEIYIMGFSLYINKFCVS
jgi:hypothetical protein